MPIHFNSTPVHEPFVISTIGNRWIQEPILRPDGYPAYHYLQTEAGCGQIKIQGKKYILNEGEGVLIAPFLCHSYRRVSERWLTSFFTVNGRMESSIADILDNRQVIFTKKEQGAKMQLFIDEVVKKYENPPTDAKALSVDCYRLLMEFADGVSAGDFNDDPLYRQYIMPVIKEIETAYGEKLTVQELSRRVYITPQYLSRLFRRFLNCSTYEYLMSYRITKAKELLLVYPRMEVQNVAQRVGFEEPSHFTAMFKKATGNTPLAFRALYR